MGRTTNSAKGLPRLQGAVLWPRSPMAMWSCSIIAVIRWSSVRWAGSVPTETEIELVVDRAGLSTRLCACGQNAKTAPDYATGNVTSAGAFPLR